jgi:hypothetical protein
MIPSSTGRRRHEHCLIDRWRDSAKARRGRRLDARKSGASRGRSSSGCATVTPRTITPLKGASELARYIPTEALGLYIAILASAFAHLNTPVGPTLDMLNFSSRWHFYFFMLLATAALVWLVYAAKQRETPAKQPGKRYNVPLLEMAVAVTAMAAWGAALPDSPFADFSWYGGWFPPIVLSTTTALLPLVAAAAGRTAPTYEQTQ